MKVGLPVWPGPQLRQLYHTVEPEWYNAAFFGYYTTNGRPGIVVIIKKKLKCT